MKGKVYIIGAGCGLSDLLTLKARYIIEKADCIIYDRLIDESIIRLANQNSSLIYLGKAHDGGGKLQEVINKTIVKNALEGKTVVRLKGGDPFIFARAGEELETLKDNNIDFEIVPGISSAIASLEYAAIPITYRNISKSFHVFTAHTMEGSNWHDFSIISKLEGTLIFLMGVKNLKKIVKELIENGMSKTTPAAVIENACLPKQKTVSGTLENIEDLCKKENINPPAIIVVGKVVDFRDRFKWFENLPLFGKSVLVTRAKNSGGYFINKLSSLGAHVQYLPMIEIENINMNELNIKKYKIVLITSANGARAFLDNIEDIRELSNIKIGVVGKKTSDVFLEYKIKPDFMPKRYLVKDLIEMSVKLSRTNDYILIVTSDLSPLNMEEIKLKYKRKFDKIIIYNTKKIIRKKDEIIDALNKAQYITFFSSSTVEAFLNSIEYDEKILKNKKIISIGPITSKKLADNNIEVFREAKVFDSDGVIEEILKT